MKYCFIHNNGTRSRFMSLKTCKRLANGKIILSKDEAIREGIYVPSADRRPVREYLPIQFVKGLTGDKKYSDQYLFNENTKRYEQFCSQYGYLIPV